MLKYFIWKLDFTDPNHGTGPQSAAKEQGAELLASQFANPDVYTGPILGYLLSGDIKPGSLDQWQVQELTQAEALAFAQAIAPDAYLMEDGIITVPSRDLLEV